MKESLSKSKARARCSSLCLVLLGICRIISLSHHCLLYSDCLDLVAHLRGWCLNLPLTPIATVCAQEVFALDRILCATELVSHLDRIYLSVNLLLSCFQNCIVNRGLWLFRLIHHSTRQFDRAVAFGFFLHRLAYHLFHFSVLWQIFSWWHQCVAPDSWCLMLAFTLAWGIEWMGNGRCTWAHWVARGLNGSCSWLTDACKTHCQLFFQLLVFFL